MKKTTSNICYRCGKTRIVIRVWKEKIENSVIENTETACPDKECQKLNEQEINKQRSKRLQMEERKKEMSRNRKNVSEAKARAAHAVS